MHIKKKVVPFRRARWRVSIPVCSSGWPPWPCSTWCPSSRALPSHHLRWRATSCGCLPPSPPPPPWPRPFLWATAAAERAGKVGPQSQKRCRQSWGPVPWRLTPHLPLSVGLQRPCPPVTAFRWGQVWTGCLPSWKVSESLGRVCRFKIKKKTHKRFNGILFSEDKTGQCKFSREFFSSRVLLCSQVAVNSVSVFFLLLPFHGLDSLQKMNYASEVFESWWILTSVELRFPRLSE